MNSNDKLRFIRCNTAHFEAAAAMYERSLKKLRETVNYPKWSDDHPSREYIFKSINRGELFACLSGKKILGAVVLSEDPEGNYSVGAWSRALNDGEYLCVHILAADPDYARQGIGGFLVDGIIEFARKSGYKAVRLDIVPGNLPAERLYKSRGFKSAGQRDLERGIADIPVFELYELNIVREGAAL